MENLSAEPLAGELRNLFRGKTFSPVVFPLFSEAGFLLSRSTRYININNKRDNNIIKSNFQALFVPVQKIAFHKIKKGRAGDIFLCRNV